MIARKLINEAITRGMRNAYLRMSPKFVCEKCSLSIPRYPGRYNKYCPECKGPLKEVAAKRRRVKEDFDQDNLQLGTESATDFKDEVAKLAKKFGGKIVGYTGTRAEVGFVNKQAAIDFEDAIDSLEYTAVTQRRKNPYPGAINTPYWSTVVYNKPTGEDLQNAPVYSESNGVPGSSDWGDNAWDAQSFRLKDRIGGEDTDDDDELEKKIKALVAILKSKDKSKDEFLF